MKHFMLKPENSLLLVIDMQEKLFNAMEAGFRDICVKNNDILLHTAKALEMPVIVSEQYTKGLGPTIEPIEKLISGYKKFEKITFSCYRDENICRELDSAGKRNVIVTGIETHVCVLQSVLDLIYQGYNVIVASDAVCSRRPLDRETAVNAMQAAGAVIYTTEIISFMLMEKAGTTVFKQLSPLFK